MINATNGCLTGDQSGHKVTAFGMDDDDMTATDIITFDNADEWDSWLAEHHEMSEIWLKIARKGSGRPSVTIDQALDVALCYGWIDSQRKACDESYYLQRYSPRRPNSPWSAINIAKANALIEEGRMREPGLAAFAVFTAAASAGSAPVVAHAPAVPKSKRGSKPSNSSGSNSAPCEPGSARK